jgi:formyltetrahydrofolate deformylase
MTTAVPVPPDDEGRLLVQGDDRTGIVAAIADMLSEAGANIVSMAQHSSEGEPARFYQRTVFHLPELALHQDALRTELQSRLGDELGLSWRLVQAARPKRVAILVSTADHCVLDLIGRQRRGEINMTIPMVIGNHPDLGDHVRYLGFPFVHTPLTRETKAEVEHEHLTMLQGNVDLVVLARYMQVLSADFLAQIAVPVINIHHSFLPAFIGANPYQRAKERGVKLIGATAHYVTEDLDEGPIIEQDVARVTHQDTALELRLRGAHVERQVLSRAVMWHCEDRVLRDGNATVIL